MDSGKGSPRVSEEDDPRVMLRGGHELVRLQATHQAGLRGNRSGRRGRGGWAKNGTGEGKTRSETTVGGAADGRRAG